MTNTICPVCEQSDHQSFWFWEKDEQLTRVWAPDTRVQFAICRGCGLIFQNPFVDRSYFSSMGFGGFDSNTDNSLNIDEPLEWLRQFTGHGKEPGHALEIYTDAPRFQSPLAQAGWTMKAVQADSILNQPQEGEEIPIDPFGINSDILDPNDRFDLIFCFDALSSFQNPVEILTKLNSHLNDNGGFYVETDNPHVQPRPKRTCLTGKDACAYPFQTLIFTMYKSGFKNHSAEICEKTRIFLTKIDPHPEADPLQLIPASYWEQVQYRFQRNYYWTKTIHFLESYQNQKNTDPSALEKIRHTLQQYPLEKQNIRDMCGPCLLFIEEIGHLKDTLAKDWALTMTRIFDILKNDYVLYDLLQRGPLEGVDTFPSLERFHFNQKMIYMATAEYFEKYFTQEEALQLCEAIEKSGRVVIGDLSSFL